MFGKSDFKTLLNDGVFVPYIEADTKTAVIQTLVDALVAGGKLADGEAAMRAVLDREATMSTGLQDGVALPHAKSDALSRLVVAIGLKPEGMDFASLDGQPSRIFVLVISPVVRPRDHMEFLAGLGLALSCPAVREQLLRVKTQAEMARLLAGE